MEKKQSSVDHIINWVTTNGLFSEDGKSITYSCAELEAVIREAKAMHKEEVIKANRDGVDMVIAKEKYITGEEYYNETFNNENTDTTT